MLKELLEVAIRFRNEEKLPPTGYKPKTPKWIIDLRGGKARLEGPYSKKDIREFLVPDRQRSGTPSKTNMKPYLVFDNARYVLGKAKNDKENEAELTHKGFVALLEEAYTETGLSDLNVIRVVLQSPEAELLREKVEPQDWIMFRVDGRYPTESKEVQEFWVNYLARELVKDNAQCSVCLKEGPVLRILPREVSVMGQKCQVISFNRGAFRSHGKEQVGNSPLCFKCASIAIDALDYLIRTRRHHRTLVSNPKGSSLENQLAVYWLKGEPVIHVGEHTYNLEALLTVLLDDVTDSNGPPAELSQLDALLSVPWAASDSVLNLRGDRFYLAVLSANKGRLVVREWFDIGIESLLENLRSFLQAVRLVDLRDGRVWPVTIPQLLKVLKTGNPNLTRSLLRTAYLGASPSTDLISAGVRRFRNPKVRQDTDALHALSAALKLFLTHQREEATRMEQLDPSRNEPAYQCGRLLAVLEEVQRRAQGAGLNTTVVDRFYGAVSTAPQANLTLLLKRAHASHLPKIRKSNRGYIAIRTLLEDLLTRLDEGKGIPRTLSLSQQADFALGFYHQRADFRKASSGDLTNKGGEE